MKLLRKKGVTSQILEIFIQDTRAGDGGGLTGLVFNSAGLTCYYHRNTGAAGGTAVTLVTMTVGTFTSSGFKEIDATNMPGWYQLCLPDAVFASGADSVSAHLKGASNMGTVPLEIQLIDIDLNDTVRAGLTALPNAAAGAANGLIGAGTGSNQIDLTGGKVKPADGSIAAATFAAGAIDNAAIAADAIGSSELAASAITEIQTGLSTLDAAGVRTAVGLASANLDSQLGAIDDFLDTEIAAIKLVTDALPNGGALTTIQSDLDDIQLRLPAPLTTGTADSGTTTTMVDAARTEADTDYWKGCLIRFTSSAISGQTRRITGFTPGTDTITFAPATTQAVGTNTYEILPAELSNLDVPSSILATQISVNTIDDFLDTEVAAIKAVTDVLPNAGALTTIQTDLDDIQARLPAALVGGKMSADVSALSAALRNQIADNILRRSFASAAASADGDAKGFRSLLGAVARLVNKSAIVSTTLTVYEADDTTALGTQTLTTDAAANPVVSADTV